MLPTKPQTVPTPASAPTQPADRQGAKQPSLPVPLSEDVLRHVGGGGLPGRGW